MIGLGAIVKAINKVLENAGSAAALGLRNTLNGQRPKPCPILVQVDQNRRQRRA
jgi:hypothetical protein